MNGKRDYEKIASILNTRIQRVETWPKEQRLPAMNTIHRITVDLADWFESENDLFDRNGFLQASGLKPRLDGLFT